MELGETTIFIVLGLPLLGFMIQAFLGGMIVRKVGPAIGKKVMGWLAVLPVAISFALAAGITYQLAQQPPSSRGVVPIALFDWISIASLRIPFELVVDPLSMTMTLVITGIGALIHLYATGYMSEERDYTRFFTYLNLFIAAMLILVLGGNLALMFIGWEGVGLCSYLLIAFWYEDVANAKAGNKAFIVNRIGDWGFTLGMFLIVAFFAGNADKLGALGADQRWLSYDVLLPNAVKLLSDNPGIATAIALLLFVGAMGKSAQFPLYLWLPDAMAGPTPVSALIHAATMVTAGVFLLNRMHVFFELSPLAMGVVTVVGAFTALFAALVAFGQTDIKKVLAYSTVSQLGFMFVACGVGAFWVGMFHVVTHAFFKALLFLGSGAVIHAMAHHQDMRQYGNLVKFLKITSWTMIIGWLAISGFPLLSGFWSKEAILGGALGNHVAEIGGIQVGPVAGWLLLGVAALTAAYMSRLTFLTFFGGQERWRSYAPAHVHAPEVDEHHAHEDHEHEDEHEFFFTSEELEEQHVQHPHHHELEPTHTPHEVPPSMSITLIVLAVLSVVGGYFLAANHLLQNWLFPDGLAYLGAEVVEGHPHGWVGQSLLYLSIAAAAVGIGYGYLIYRRGLPNSEGEESSWHPFRRAAGEQFGYDAAMMEASVEGGGQVGKFLWKDFDAGFVDGIFNGIAFLFGQFGRLFRVLQTGYARTYALLMLIGGVGLLGWFWYASNKAEKTSITTPAAIAAPEGGERL